MTHVLNESLQAVLDDTSMLVSLHINIMGMTWFIICAALMDVIGRLVQENNMSGNKDTESPYDLLLSVMHTARRWCVSPNITPPTLPNTGNPSNLTGM
jgi:hypothetical protein